MPEFETIPRLKCQNCEEVVEEDAGPLYECGDCGTTFNRENSYANNHQCPDCHKFAAKIAEKSCPQCCEGELEEVEVFVCPECDEGFEDEVEAREHFQDEHETEAAEAAMLTRKEVQE